MKRFDDPSLEELLAQAEECINGPRPAKRKAHPSSDGPHWSHSSIYPPTPTPAVRHRAAPPLRSPSLPPRRAKDEPLFFRSSSPQAEVASSPPANVSLPSTRSNEEKVSPTHETRPLPDDKDGVKADGVASSTIEKIMKKEGLDHEEAQIRLGQLAANGHDLEGFDMGPMDEESTPIDPLVEEKPVTADDLQQRAAGNVKSGFNLLGEIIWQMNDGGEKIWTINAVDPPFRSFFKFDRFNRMQSVVFQMAYKSDRNIVVSAPTGSGKTVVFELAFLRMLEQWRGYEEKRVAIYIAPTKALCAERSSDWDERLKIVKASWGHPVTCTVLTGDTEGIYLSKALKDADLIVTTPEKWDSVTRRSLENRRLLNRLALVMVDETHLLGESRGATLEVVIARMKTFSSQIRFVTVSASVPNVDDIARWLGPGDVPLPLPDHVPIDQDGRKTEPVDPDEVDANFAARESADKALTFLFGEDYRPVPLKKRVEGYLSANNWTLNATLDKELFPLILRLQKDDGYQHKNKPILVFCPTRRACQMTAAFMKIKINEVDSSHAPWQNPGLSDLDLQKVVDENLRSYIEDGIAVHHAGLDLKDRQLVEDWFRAGHIKLLCSTSTLAVGVNLPAHTVIVKGTTVYSGPAKGFREYTDIEIQQMMGRAGRPQYDNCGVVILMCSREKYDQYSDILNSTTVIESHLHHHLTEHINSEISRQTITDRKSAREWLKSTFLWVRIQQSPHRYELPDVPQKPGGTSWQDWLEDVAEKAIQLLMKYVLVEYNDTEDEVLDEVPPEPSLRKIRSSTFGLIMSQMYISFSTMCAFMTLKPDASFDDLFLALCHAQEFADLRVRPGETAVFNLLRKETHMRYTFDDAIRTPGDKVRILLTACFGNVLHDFQEKLRRIAKEDEGKDKEDKNKVPVFSPVQALLVIFQSAPRLGRAILRVCSARQYGVATKNAMILVRTISGQAWEDDATVFRQLHSIGPKSISVLRAEGIHSFTQLQAKIEKEPEALQVSLGRTGNFHSQLSHLIQCMPIVNLEVTMIKDEVPGDVPPVVTIEIAIKLAPGHSDGLPVAKGKAAKPDKASPWRWYNLACLVVRSDGKMINYRAMPLSKLSAKTGVFEVEAELTKPDQCIEVYAGVNERAGVLTSVIFTPEIPASHYPPVPDPPTPVQPPSTSICAENHGGKVRLPNGNVPCQHDCPANCNHICCRDGVKLGSDIAMVTSESSPARPPQQSSSDPLRSDGTINLTRRKTVKALQNVRDKAQKNTEVASNPPDRDEHQNPAPADAAFQSQGIDLIDEDVDSSPLHVRHSPVNDPPNALEPDTRAQVLATWTDVDLWEDPMDAQLGSIFAEKPFNQEAQPDPILISHSGMSTLSPSKSPAPPTWAVDNPPPSSGHPSFPYSSHANRVEAAQHFASRTQPVGHNRYDQSSQAVPRKGDVPMSDDEDRSPVYTQGQVYAGHPVRPSTVQAHVPPAQHDHAHVQQQHYEDKYDQTQYDGLQYDEVQYDDVQYGQARNNQLSLDHTQHRADLKSQDQDSQNQYEHYHYHQQPAVQSHLVQHGLHQDQHDHEFTYHGHDNDEYQGQAAMVPVQHAPDTSRFTANTQHPPTSSSTRPLITVYDSQATSYDHRHDRAYQGGLQNYARPYKGSQSTNLKSVLPYQPQYPNPNNRDGSWQASAYQQDGFAYIQPHQTPLTSSTRPQAVNVAQNQPAWPYQDTQPDYTPQPQAEMTSSDPLAGLDDMFKSDGLFQEVDM